MRRVQDTAPPRKDPENGPLYRSSEIQIYRSGKRPPLEKFRSSEIQISSFTNPENRPTSDYS
jgi:hypothetical protein